MKIKVQITSVTLPACKIQHHDKGLHVFCEKPMARSVEACQAIHTNSGFDSISTQYIYKDGPVVHTIGDCFSI